MTINEFDQTIERHRAGLVRFAGSVFPNARVAPEDIVEYALERVIATGAYLKYEFEPDAVRAPSWILTTVKNSGLALVARANCRSRLGRQAAEERVLTDDLTMAIDGGDEEAGEPASAELDTSQRHDFLDSMVDLEDDIARHAAFTAALDTLPGTMARALMDVYGRELSWAEAAAAQGYTGNVAAFKRRGLRALARLRERLVSRP
jgi:DNA-directed RNA polymerase specialized sigma24 family protein